MSAALTTSSAVQSGDHPAAGQPVQWVGSLSVLVCVRYRVWKKAIPALADPVCLLCFVLAIFSIDALVEAAEVVSLNLTIFVRVVFLTGILFAGLASIKFEAFRKIGRQ
jgi:hypothetical protein